MRALLVLVLLIAALLPAPMQAQSDIPVVYGVFFYSPTCPHCHKVMEDVFPVMQAEFGDQFQILYVNVTQPGGNVLFQSAYNTPNLPLDSLGVPTLVIGREVMVGDVDIPARAPDLVRNGLASGGIGLPAIPGLAEAYSATLAGAANSGVVNGPSASETNPEPLDAADVIAATVLTLLTVSLVAVIGGGVRTLRADKWRIANSELPRYAAILTALLGVGVGLTLASEALLSPVVLLLAVLEIAALAVVAFVLWRLHADKKTVLRPPNWLLPVASVGGLAVAAYLSYVEITQSDAICGLVGDCNVVQQSAYARLFGVLPVGVFGILGYLVILALWFIGYRRSSSSSPIARALLLGASLFGVAFSIYLTILEVFVIGAVCMWCISSALVSVLILWLVAGDGWDSVRELRRNNA